MAKKVKLINFRATSRDTQLLTKVAKKRGVTKSQFLRQAIHTAARESGSGEQGGGQQSPSSESK
jgi:uncharacterized protein (DUF1778 family)